MPITTQIKGYPFEVSVGAKEIEGVILSDQVRSLDWRACQATKITSVSENVLQESIFKLKLII